MKNSIKTLKITLHSHFNALTPFYCSYSTSSFFSSFSSPVSSSLFSFGTILNLTRNPEGLDLKNTFWIGCTLPQNWHGLDLSISSSPFFSFDVLSSGISEPSGGNPESEFVSLFNSFSNSFASSFSYKSSS